MQARGVKAKAFKTNIVIVIARFLYEYILIKFGCPWIIIINQGVHFISVTTLTLGSPPKQGLAKVLAEREAQESHLMLLGV
jgi:hypothetical protein